MKLSVALAIFRTLSSKGASFSAKLVHSWILMASGMRVMSGPFQGMKYVSQSAGSGYLPKLLGTYELELAGLVESAIARRPEIIVDAGAAEGYFAVGLASRCPHARVVTFDPDIKACYFLQMLADFNDVRSRVTISCKECHIEDFSILESAKRPFLIMDVEGAEMELLMPDRAKGLRGAEILVELHEPPGCDCAAELSDRFAHTHTVRIICSRPRIAADSPMALGIAGKAGLKAMDEGRMGGQRWIHLNPI